MKTLGIIVEYNPFHYGHKLHIEKSIKKTGANTIVAIMSGNYTQRGELAIYDKFTRAKCAVDMGVNLVIELPLIYSISSAENFSYGAVNILNATGVIDCISFGSENLTEEDLKLAVSKTNTTEYEQEIKKHISEGNSYAKAKELALNYKLSSNEILAFNYIKALDKIDSKIKPYTIKRENSSYLSDTTEGKISSAKSIRNKIICNEDVSYYVPDIVYHNIKNKKFVSNNDATDMIIYSILNNDLKNIYMANEGLDNLLIKAAMTSNNYDELLNNLVSKRYSKTRIQRLLLYVLHNITKEQQKFLYNNPYIKTLAFDEKGRKLLSEIKKKATLPIITPNSNNLINKAELKASNLYYYLSNDNRFKDLKKAVYYKKGFFKK